MTAVVASKRCTRGIDPPLRICACATIVAAKFFRNLQKFPGRGTAVVCAANDSGLASEHRRFVPSRNYSGLAGIACGYGRSVVTLRLKLFTPLVLVSLATVVYLTAYWAPAQVEAALEARAVQTQSHLRTVAEALAVPLARGELDAVHRLLDELPGRNRHWRALWLVNVRGRIVYPIEPAPSLEIGTSIQRLSADIRDHDRIIGRLELAVDNTPLRRSSEAQVRSVLIALFSGIALMAGSIGLLIEVLVLRPLARVAVASRQLADSDYEAALPAARNDEMGSLIRDFAAMRSTLRDQRDRLANEVAERYTIMESLPDVLFMLDTGGRLVSWNRRLEEVTGCSPEQLRGIDALSLIHADDRPIATETVARVLRDGHARTRACLQCRDGRVIPYAWSGAVVCNAAGQVTGFTGTGHDLTFELRVEDMAEHLGRIIEASFNEIYVFDAASLRFLQVNRGAQRNLGYSMEELRVLTPVDLKPAYTREQFKTLIAPLRDGSREQLVFETEHQRKDGSRYPVEVRLQLSHSRLVPVFMAIIQDISLRKQAEASLRRSNEELERSVQSRTLELMQQKYALDQHAIVAITDPAGRIVYVNDRFCAISGYGRDELLGQNHQLLNSALHPPEFFIKMWRTISSGQVWKGEIRNRTKDGRLYWVDTTIVPFLGESGRPEQYIAIRTDITSQKLAVERLRQSEERFSKAFHASPDMLSLSRLGDNVFIDANESFLRITGFARDEVIGRSSFDLGIWGDLDTARAVKRTLIENGQVRDLPVVGRSRSGELLPVSYSADVIDVDGRRCVLAVVHDMRKIRQAEAALADARDAALAASEAKSSFLATVSHEIRTPLNGVLGAAQLLEMVVTTPEQHDYVRLILNSGESLLLLINEILDFSRIESGHLRIESIDFELGELVDAVGGSLAVLATQKGLALETVVDPEIPDWLRGDPLRLRQILVNLIGNAIKFTETGGVTVRVRPFWKDDRVSMLRFEVIDTGSGVAKDAQARIFEAFTQADGSITRRHGGTGLGLAIAQRLVALMGGEIGVDSEPGSGSTFWFTAQFDKAAPLVNQGAVTVLTEIPAGVRGHALLVEDNHTNQRVARQMLEYLGFTVDVVNDGSAALEKLSAGGYDLVLMDCQMPILDGLAATRAWRARETERGLARLPIIALTANVLPEERQAVLAAGMDDFLAKPVTLERMRAVIEPWRPVSGSRGPGPLVVHSDSRSAEPCGADTERFDTDRLTELRTLFGGQFEELVANFLHDTPRRLAVMDAGVQAEDRKRLKESAHAIKGSAANMAAPRLALLCETLERMARADTFEAIGAQVRLIGVEYQQVAAALHNGAGRKVG